MIKLRLKELCRQKGITFIELADRVGLSRISVQNFNAGRQFPSSDNLEKIAKELGVEVYELFLPEESEQEPVNIQFRCSCGTVHTITIKWKRNGFCHSFFVFRMSYLRAEFFSFAFLNLAMVVSLTSSMMILRNSRVSEKHFGPIVIPSPIVFNETPSTITEFPNSNIFVI